MANKLRGEAKIPGTEYVLKYTINSLCELEDAANVSVPELIAKLQSKPNLSTIRLLLWGGLRSNHPELSLEDAGDLMADIFTSSDAVDAIESALAASLGSDEKDTPGRADEKKAPRRATG